MVKNIILCYLRSDNVDHDDWVTCKNGHSIILLEYEVSVSFLQVIPFLCNENKNFVHFLKVKLVVSSAKTLSGKHLVFNLVTVLMT